MCLKGHKPLESSPREYFLTNVGRSRLVIDSSSTAHFGTLKNVMKYSIFVIFGGGISDLIILLTVVFGSILLTDRGATICGKYRGTR